MPLVMEQPYPMRIEQQGDRILLHVEEYDTLRVVHMSGGTVPPDTKPSILGYSVGAWDGPTLVVETTRINFPLLTERGVPLSEEVSLTERFTPAADGGRPSNRN